MKNLRLKTLDGPVPGENYLSNTKNYPWHQPPEVDDYDEGVEFIFKKMLKKKRINSLVNAMEMGMPINVLTSTVLMVGISKGYFTPDMAVLLAGPMAHILKMLAEEYGVDYEMGLDEAPQPTTAHYRGLEKIREMPMEMPLPMAGAKPLEEVAPESEEEQSAPAAGGFMGGL